MFEQLIQQLYQGDDKQQIDAIYSLGRSEDSKAVAPLVRKLHQASPTQMVAICEALGLLSDLRSVRPLLSQIKHSNAHVRKAAFNALLSIGQNKAHNIPNALAWESDFTKPSAELTQIAWHTDVEAMQSLQQALHEDDLEIKTAAIYTLGYLGIFGCLESIAQLLYQHPDDEIRSAAIYALGQYAEQGDQQIQSYVLQVFQWVLSSQDSDLDEQTEVLKILADLALPGSQTIFRHALQHRDQVIKQFGMIGLARVKDYESLPHLMQMLQAKNSVSVTRNLLYAIASFQQKECIPTLLRFAAGKGSELRSAVAYALQRMPQQDCWQEIQVALQDPDAQIRSIAAHLLGYIPNESVLTQVLKDHDPLVRKTAILSIGTAYLRNLRGGVQAHLQDENWKVRVAAAESLKRLKDPASIPVLRAALADEHAVVRHAVESSLNALLAPKS